MAKAEQSSIYREVERLLFWAMDVVDRLPKSLAMQELGKKVMNDLTDCLDAVTLALQAEKGAARLEFIDVLILRMTSVKTIFRIMYEKSKQQKTKVLTPKQYTVFLEFAGASLLKRGGGVRHRHQRSRIDYDYEGFRLFIKWALHW